jgi:hypothetical protein
MKKYTAVLLVGHAHWGKSATLAALTDGRRPRYRALVGHDFFIRRMSNDDHVDAYKRFIDNITKEPARHILAAFCPNFEDKDPWHTEYALAKLYGAYRVCSFILKHQYGATNEVTDQEVDRLRRAGDVHVYTVRHAEAPVRAKALREYISTLLN